MTLLIELKFYGTDLRYIFRYRFHSALTELAFLSKVPLHPVVPQKHLNNFLNRCNEANYSSVLWTIYLSVKLQSGARVLVADGLAPDAAGCTLCAVFQLIGSRLDWHYRYPKTFYHITVTGSLPIPRW